MKVARRYLLFDLILCLLLQFFYLPCERGMAAFVRGFGPHRYCVIYALRDEYQKVPKPRNSTEAQQGGEEPTDVSLGRVCAVPDGGHLNGRTENRWAWSSNVE